MLLELKRELPKKSGAVLSRLFVDGSFFGYGLENKDYMFPDGKYNLWARTSPSFKTEKVYIDVPGRSNIMFHGGNEKEQSRGCVLIAANRDGDTIQGDLSSKLFNVVDSAYKNGEGIGLKVSTPAKTYIAMGAFVLGAGAFYLIYKHTKRGNK